MKRFLSLLLSGTKRARTSDLWRFKPALYAFAPSELRFHYVGRGRIELPTHGFSVHCSTNWATSPFSFRLLYLSDYSRHAGYHTNTRRSVFPSNFTKETSPSLGGRRLLTFSGSKWSRTTRVIWQQVYNLSRYPYGIYSHGHRYGGRTRVCRLKVCGPKLRNQLDEPAINFSDPGETRTLTPFETRS